MSSISPTPTDVDAALEARDRGLILAGILLALFLGALDQTIVSTALPRIVEDLHAVQELYDKRGDFFEFFVSPRIEPHEKKRILQDLLEDKVERPVMGLLHVLIDKRRELYYDNIVGEFHAVRDLREGVLNAYVTSARPLMRAQSETTARSVTTA